MCDRWKCRRLCLTRLAEISVLVLVVVVVIVVSRLQSIVEVTFTSHRLMMLRYFNNDHCFPGVYSACVLFSYRCFGQLLKQSVSWTVIGVAFLLWTLISSYVIIMTLKKKFEKWRERTTLVRAYTASNESRNLCIAIKINFRYQRQIQAHFSSTFRRK